ncbi:MAG: hypothetical protein ACTSYX_09165 [Candidatus Thorarchaeota archaeon]
MSDQEVSPEGSIVSAGSGRVHLHTTISATTRDLLRQMAGDTGRINDVIEVAVAHYSKRREMPDCDQCEHKQTAKTRDLLIQSADMMLLNSQLLSVLLEYAMGMCSLSNLPSKIRRAGTQQTKLLRGIGVIDEDFWVNNFDSFVLNARFLEKLGIVGPVEVHPERKTLLVTTRLAPEMPELTLTLLLATWDEARLTVDFERVADNKFSFQWVDALEFEEIREDRDNRVNDLWRERRETATEAARREGTVTLSPTLLDWLATHTLEDPISDRILVSFREFAYQTGFAEPAETNSTIDHVKEVMDVVGTTGLWERSRVTQDGELVRVQIRCRTPAMKELGAKMIRALLALEGIEEVSREEGVATTIIYFKQATEVGRKYPAP